MKLIWNRHDAEELTQETFRLALANGRSIESCDTMPWLMRTVANLCLNFRRKRRPVPLNELIEPTSQGDAQDHAASAERLHALREEITALPPQQRLAITLRTMEQLSYEETARVMELSVAAVRTHVHLARKALAAAMTEHRP